jgi:IgA Peptidase M64
VTGTPGAAMLNKKLFVVVADGSLWERIWPDDGSGWVWTPHGRPANKRIVHGPGAAMMDQKLFVVTEDGHLWERHWRTDLTAWVWNDHGTPPGTQASTSPGAAMLDSKLFVGCANGHLFERFWNGTQWVWVDHGSPPGTSVSSTPGAAMMGIKFFVSASNGHLFERFWDGAQWVWVDHGSPPGTSVSSAPGAAMMDSKLFVSASNGTLFERFWDGGQWVWVSHGAPPGANANGTPGAAMMNSKLFVAGSNGHLFERFWDGAQWVWVDHGTAYHDQAQHVVGAPGTDPKLTIAVMGDGYTESDMGAYHNRVDDQVLGALRLDQLATHQGALRIIRIDVVSVESGVRERRYNADGTIKSDVFKFSRLGVIPNDDWNRCWFDHSDFTDARIEKLRRRFAADADHVVVLVKSSTWGGCSSVGPGVGFFTEGSGRVTVAHEMGHNLFFLDDEYVNDTKSFGGISGRANTSETLTNWATLKWSALVSPGAPVPGDAANLPAGWNNQTSVTAFEGAGGSFKTGLFRPVIECRMNQNDPPWCPVCGQKIANDLAVFE